MAIEAKINVQEGKEAEWTFPVLMELVISPDAVNIQKDRVLVFLLKNVQV